MDGWIDGQTGGRVDGWMDVPHGPPISVSDYSSTEVEERQGNYLDHLQHFILKEPSLTIGANSV